MYYYYMYYYLHVLLLHVLFELTLFFLFILQRCVGGCHYMVDIESDEIRRCAAKIAGRAMFDECLEKIHVFTFDVEHYCHARITGCGSIGFVSRTCRLHGRQ